jgi:hypothetical protein
MREEPSRKKNLPVWPSCRGIGHDIG